MSLYSSLQLSRATRLLNISTSRFYYRQTRCFSISARRDIRVSEFSEGDFDGLKVNVERLMADIHNTCQWGKGERWGKGPNETGMRRLALTDEDKQARDWFVSTTKALGCTVTVDAMGNIFAVRPGLNNDAPPTFAGSHLDTQPSGGRYDGILGVTAAVEMLRVMNENWVETEFPVGAVNWTNEEGARFPISMVASAVWAHDIPQQKAHDLREVSGSATMRSELERIGYLGEVPSSHESIPMAAHFELHIEQGPTLEASSLKVGVVQGVQAYKWFTVVVRGRDAHTGTTPFSARSDALLMASKMIVQSHRVASRHNALASTGILTLEPGSTNTIPRLVKFSLDIRAPADEIVENVEAECRKAFEDIAAGNDVDGLNADGTPGKSCAVQFITDSVSPAVNFDQDCIVSIKSAAAYLSSDKQTPGQGVAHERSRNSLTMDMVSGAGHDSVNTSKVCPTSMIFIPCREGVSHNPAEFSTPEDCGIGAQVLLGAVLRYDRLRAAKYL